MLSVNWRVERWFQVNFTRPNPNLSPVASEPVSFNQDVTTATAVNKDNYDAESFAESQSQMPGICRPILKPMSASSCEMRLRYGRDITII